MQATQMSQRRELPSVGLLQPGTGLSLVRFRFPLFRRQQQVPRHSRPRLLQSKQPKPVSGRLVVYRFRLFAGLLGLLLAMLPAANAQSVTGQISGTVVDASGAAVVSAAVTLTNDLSKQERTFATSGSGAFIFTGLVPGDYSIKVAGAGFKNYEQRAIRVAAQERVDLHEIALAVGDVTSTVEVTASTVHVATDSSDRSIAIDLHQIDDTPTRGRNPVNDHYDAAGRADRGVERLSRLVGRRNPGSQRRPNRPDRPEYGWRRQPGFRKPEPRIYFAQRRRHRRSQTAGVQLHRRVWRPHRRPVDPDDQERNASVPRHGVLLHAPRDVERQRVLQ